ncbi:ammonia-forming cytochrome c nitrite reductase subunit c552 [Campylobacter sp. faydin G-140]|uniref:ammonia-forming cytochrome c nitrite reductase subunit c552 n=1 Tax=Campylobacter anatolicus TaxID=2829105 RepID=UPI001B9C963B|nr:ammonia-forming cytochrome c nitrite reductase subunit c552 [Campylobacter anatolicus]MBR8465285.1 ammonia-forming cytochrome c nitrite reductase subunit c552 [Campylobacter anatolicus]
MKKYILFIVVCLVVASGFFLMRDIEFKEKQRNEINQAHALPQDPYKVSSYSAFYPRQVHSYLKDMDNNSTRDFLVEKPNYAVIRMGEGDFGAWYDKAHGHFYSSVNMLLSINSGTPKDPNKFDGELPSRCFTCHSGDFIRLMKRDGELEFYSKSLASYAAEAQNGIGCIDCHDPKTMELSMNRSNLDNSLSLAGRLSFNKSSHQEKRSLVCAQCHVLTYTKKIEWTDSNGTKRISKGIISPWSNGIGIDEAEAHYDDPKNFGGKRAVHILNSFSKAPTILAEHPDYEIFIKGTHYKNGVACADCHIPYVSEGSTKYSHHEFTNPLKNMQASCLTCHPGKQEELTQILADKRKAVYGLGDIILDNLASAHLEAQKAWEIGASEDEMKEPLDLIRKAQWRFTAVFSSYGSYIHATDESMRLYSNANEYVQNARIKLTKILAKYGIIDYKVPEFANKQEIFNYAKPEKRIQAIKEKCEWIEEYQRKWYEESKNNGTLDVNDAKDKVFKAQFEVYKDICNEIK